ncbi:hypothetical protein GR216_32045 [Rhizobium leguminosarum]|nr:hypothetical protein [Rhizobium ruizarguesonis]NEJ39719.1 hypothetical protein [Rhizobium ruizarguesonis]
MIIDKELPNAAIPRADIGEEFLQALDTAFGERCDAHFATVIGIDHLAIVNVVGIAGDFMEEFKVLAISAATYSIV